MSQSPKDSASQAGGQNFKVADMYYYFIPSKQSFLVQIIEVAEFKQFTQNLLAKRAKTGSTTCLFKGASTLFHNIMCNYNLSKNES